MNPLKQEIIFVPHKCRLPWCKTCGIGFWGKVRSRIKPHLHLFKRARLFTLTVDPKNFESGQQAYELIEKKHQYIKRLLRLTGFKNAFKVMAFHQSKPSRPDAHNWPHWHIVVDMADVGRVDLRRIWSLWRDKWKIGGLDLQINRRCRNASQAVNYAVNYCQHQSGVVADWVKDAKRAPRAYEFIGDLRKAVAEHEKPHIEEPEAGEATGYEPTDYEQFSSVMLKERAATYVGDRLNGCNEKSVAVLKTEWHGRTSYEYIGNLPFSVGQIAYASKFLYVDVVRDVAETETGAQQLIYIPLKNNDDPEWIVERVKNGVWNMFEKQGYEVIPI